MTVLALLCALATATSIGYYAGRRADSRPSTWKTRTSRVALGRLAMSFLVLVAARRFRRKVKTVTPLELLRAGVARVLSY